MALNLGLQQKLKRKTTDWDESDTEEIRSLYKSGNKEFIELMNSIFTQIKAKKDVDYFIYIFTHLSEEIVDVSPFLAANINRILKMMMDYGYYKKIAEYDKLIIECGNMTFLTLMKEYLTTRRDLDKYLSSLEIYKIKKTIFVLSEKYNQKDEITYKIQMELASIDMEWRDNIDF